MLIPRDTGTCVHQSLIGFRKYFFDQASVAGEHDAFAEIGTYVHGDAFVVFLLVERAILNTTVHAAVAAAIVGFGGALTFFFHLFQLTAHGCKMYAVSELEFGKFCSLGQEEGWFYVKKYHFFLADEGLK